jgi:dTDP-4-dehydrorhamnose reductase
VPASILITGAGGQVANELAESPSSHRLTALNRRQLDITDRAQVENVFTEIRPDLVINAAAYTQVDRAEQESELAYAVNRDAVANLAEACAGAGIPLLHLSTDYVFDGSLQRAYRESDAISPLGVYGESKAAGEIALRERLEAHIVLRTSWVFSATGSNFVKTMLRLGRERETLGIVDDQRGCPTSAHSIAAALLRIADACLQGDAVEWGTYHYCGRPATTWYGFARSIFAQAGGYDGLELQPITTADYPTPARRPANSVLDCTRIERGFGIRQSDWREELAAVLRQLAD